MLYHVYQNDERQVSDNMDKQAYCEIEVCMISSGTAFMKNTFVNQTKMEFMTNDITNI